MSEFFRRNRSGIFFLVCAAVFVVVVWQSLADDSDPDMQGNATDPHEAKRRDAGGANNADQTAQRQAAAVVLETHDIGQYTIMKLGMGEEEHIWVASPPLQTRIGDLVVVENAALMTDFYSSSLDRTFAEIYFVDAAAVVDQDRKIIRKSRPPTAVPTQPAANVNVKSLTPPEGGISIAKLNQSFTELDGQEVKIRGTVVKATPAILGTNWYHIQDGSAEGLQGDVIVTSDDTLETGIVIAVTGVVEINREKGEFMMHEFVVKATNVMTEQESP
ncbi:MAG: hypothetical protein MPJ50_04550 [Pirellulales bacterium]|nr:hypothetical protein [Pirellulales bacterium]